MIIEAQQRTITDLTVKLDLLLKTQVPSHRNITNSSQTLPKNPSKDKAVNLKRTLNNSSDLSTDDDTLPDGFTKVKPRKTRRNKTDTTGFPPLPPPKSQSETSHSTASDSNKQPVPNLSVTSTPSTSQAPEDTTAQPPRKVRVTPIVLRDASRWRGVNHKFIPLGIKFERAVAVDAGIRIIPKSDDDYRRIIRLFREEEVPHHTFPLPSERNIHAVIRGVHATLSEIEIKEELQQRGYSPLHIIRLKRGGGVPMPLVVVILPKIEKSQQLFNEHELLGLAIRVEVQKNSRLIGQCHRCQKYGHAQSYCTAPPKCLKCASDHMTHLCPQTEQQERKCANCGGGHPANSRTCRFAPKKNLQVIAQRRNVSYADAARDATRAAPSVGSSANTQNVDLATALRSLQQIIGPLISATQALQAIFPANG
ncbi:unnamed protein product [Acanthoscelides obtectus]|uniref:Pre-C2HC domain-containing protein n=1 Tax=Acanthoscelides obtectus TaxID=200917 RepID=A0A9P0LXQ6_ACAOB|nr:unnamed protein product [Acanthoscelides obtectus]CAK1655770.1 Nucleic-acid-binding protein from transposon X-element [Acanthoscelides obtectus]